MINVWKPRLSLGSVYAILIAITCSACSAASDSEDAQNIAGGGTTSVAGSGPKAGDSSSGSGGSSATSGSSQGGQNASGMSGASGGSSANGGSSASGGTGGEEDGGSGGGECMPRTSVTIGTHIVMNISWPDTLVTAKGSGQFHLWNLSKLTMNGTAFTGETRPCGSVLPPLQLTVIAGGGQALIEIPDATWDLPTMPKFPGTGTLAGWTVDSKFDQDTTTALVGLMMADPESAWPGKGSMIMSVDHDGDSQPGIKGIPKADGGFVRPPVSILGQAGAVADQVHLVTRTAVALDGAMTSCTEHSGTADVKYFDNHVVGCHIFNGADCDATQADFIDTNRTIYEVSDASYESKFLDDSATCADVRAALPQ